MSIAGPGPGFYAPNFFAANPMPPEPNFGFTTPIMPLPPQSNYNWFGAVPQIGPNLALSGSQMPSPQAQNIEATALPGDLEQFLNGGAANSPFGGPSNELSGFGVANPRFEMPSGQAGPYSMFASSPQNQNGLGALGYPSLGVGTGWGLGMGPSYGNNAFGGGALPQWQLNEMGAGGGGGFGNVQSSADWINNTGLFRNPYAGQALASVGGAESGGYTSNPNPRSGANGMYQWLNTPGSPRLSNAQSMLGKAWDDPQAQSAVAIGEIMGGKYPGVNSVMNNPRASLGQMQSALINQFEAPGGYATNSGGYGPAGGDMARAQGFASQLESAYARPSGISSAASLGPFGR